MSTTAEQRRIAMQRAFDREAERLLAALEAPAPQLPGLSGQPSAEELGGALARNANRMSEARAAVYASALAREEVVDLLGVTTQQVSNLLAAGKLVALDGPQGQHFPSWQFDSDGTRIRLDGITEVAERYPGGVVSLSLWAIASNPMLNGGSPAEALRDGDLDAVLAAVAVTDNL